MGSEEPSNKNEKNEITIIYDYNKSKNVNINIDYKEKVKKEIGETISREKLGMVDKAEQMLIDLGFHQVRVRIHGSMARIEILPEEFEKLISNGVRGQITTAFKALGFTYVTMDLIGYRTGSMNEVLK